MEKKNKATVRFNHMLFSDLLKFIILSLLSHTQDPFPASIIPALSQSPCPFWNSIVSYRAESAFCTDVMSFFYTPAATTDKRFSVFFVVFTIFLFWFELLQWKKDTNDHRLAQHGVAGSFSAAKYTLLHSALVIFLMAAAHSCCKVSPGQILSLPLSSTALIALASGHSQACRKKSPLHHWRRADTPPTPHTHHH